MSRNKFEYVQQFEQEDLPTLPNCWFVVKTELKNFDCIAESHKFSRPNDDRVLELMSKVAQLILDHFKDIVMAYGHGSEYSFIFKKCMGSRQGSKIRTTLVSLFSSSFAMYWPEHFEGERLSSPPQFDAKIFLYPESQNLRDYLSWRQAECQNNNLYNTVFWKLVQNRGLNHEDAHDRLKGTPASQKTEILFADFSFNYNKVNESYKNGSLILAKEDAAGGDTPDSAPQNSTDAENGPSLQILHCYFGKKFWDEHQELINSKKD